MASQDVFTLNGLEDMAKKMQYVADNYPYESEELLTKMGNKFRKAVKEKTPESKIDSYGQLNNKRKLIKSYKISKPIGYGKNIHIEFRSTAPHFHLLERSHKTSNGKSTNPTAMVDKTTNEFQKEFPEDVEKMVDRMVRKLLK